MAAEDKNKIYYYPNNPGLFGGVERLTRRARQLHDFKLHTTDGQAISKTQAGIYAAHPGALSIN